jgi:hypothetical protein
VQTVSPVVGFEAQEFTALGVAIAAADPVGSIGTTWTPVDTVLPHEPFGTYEDTVFP